MAKSVFIFMVLILMESCHYYKREKNIIQLSKPNLITVEAKTNLKLYFSVQNKEAKDERVRFQLLSKVKGGTYNKRTKMRSESSIFP